MKKKIVNAIGYFNGKAGYNILTRNFFSQLEKRMTVLEFDLDDSPRTNMKRFESLLSSHKREEAHYINIMVDYGSKMGFLDRFLGTKIAYTVWESTKVPDDWIDPLKAVDMIWVPSNWGRQIMIENGFSEDKIEVVPGGVDSEIFSPLAKPHPELSKIDKFKFIHVGRYEERKGTPQLIRAFDEEFGGSDGVVLVLVSHNPFIENFDLWNEINKLDIKHHDQVIAIEPFKEHATMASLFTACDAAIFPSRAEGWGLPILEAMACGLPAITTDYSAPTEFVSEANAYLLSYELCDITQPYFLSHSGNYGKWAEPDGQQLRQLMREVFENRRDAKIRGLGAAIEVAHRWTWDHAVDIAIDILEKIGSKNLDSGSSPE